MSDKPSISVQKNGPYLVTGCRNLKNFVDGKLFNSEGTVALCRCGSSKNKPYCDGTHKAVGFTDEKAADRTPDKRENYQAEGITVHDNRGICAHAGRCTDGLPAVFRLKQEPFIDPNGASPSEIAAQIQLCPSGALSYSMDGEEHRDRDAEPAIWVAPNGPYAIQGGAEVADVEWGEGASREHFDLCRCGHSKNKPFCSGAHWYHAFDEHAPKREE